MRFKYPFSPDNPYFKPLIKIGFTKDKRPLFEYLTLLDSGADFCVLHSSIAKLLGIDLRRIKETQSFMGVGKAKRSLKGKWAIVDIIVIQKGKSNHFSSYVVFSDDIPEDGYPLVGIRGFFDKFKEITFSHKDKEIYLDF